MMFVDRGERFIWVVDKEKGYVPCKILEEHGNGSVTVEFPSRRTAKLSGDKLYKTISRIESLSKDYSDMVRMEDVNEATIVHNLQGRFDADNIYTNIGTILVSINPFKWMDHLYTPDIVQSHFNVKAGEESEPHVFQIASAAYRLLRGEQVNQAVIISGESGAGKTEATKKCLEFFAAVAGRKDVGDGPGVERKLLSANPILEAFGNAKTVRNNNSSRFGKWMVVHFDDRFEICASQIVNYLLEKSRVVLQSAGERNYHAFYQLASNSKLAQQFGVEAPAQYHYTNQSGCVDIENRPDSQEFVETVESMYDILGLPRPADVAADPQVPEAFLPAFQLVAGVLHLGNISFTPLKPGDAHSECKTDKTPACNLAVRQASELLGMPPDSLRRCLETKLIRTGRDSVLQPLTQEAACAARDSLAKNLYARMFDWLVHMVNQAMVESLGDGKQFIGVLDIFGFEIFEHNSFEQLCINFCNEKLQQHFNTHVFKEEEKCYQAEEIDYSDIEFVDNQDVLDLIEKRSAPTGLLVALDDQVKLGSRGSDENFLKAVTNSHSGKSSKKSGHKRFITRSAKDRSLPPMAFGVNHYAGTVYYDADGFLEKNKDSLSANLQELCETSTFSFVPLVMLGNFKRGGGSSPVPAGAAAGGGGRASGGGKKGSASPLRRQNSSKKTAKSQGGHFRAQLDTLMKTLNTTFPHYIRCIKPTDKKKPNTWESAMCLKQLRYAGVFEAVRVRQLGFPFRWSHEVFYKRYRCCGWNTARFRALIPEGTDYRAASEELLTDLRTIREPERPAKIVEPLQSTKDVKFGKTMVLYRAEPNRILEMLRDLTRAAATRLGQRVFRGFRGRKRFASVLRVFVEIRAAIASRELDRVQQAVAAGEACEFQLFILREARALQKRLEEERDCRVRLEELEPKDPALHFEQYTDAIAWAQRLGLQTVAPEAAALLTRICDRYASVKARKDAKEKLERGVEIGDGPMIKEAIAALEEFAAQGWDSVVPDTRIAEAQQLLVAIAKEDEMLAELRGAFAQEQEGINGLPGQLTVSGQPIGAFGQAAGAAGGVGGGDIAAAPDSALKRALESSADLRLQTKVGKFLRSSATLVLGFRAALGTDDWVKIEQLGRQAEQQLANATLAREAEREVKLVLAELADRHLQMRLSQAMSIGAADGEVGKLKMGQCRVDHLEALIAEHKPRRAELSPCSQLLVDVAGFVVRLRKAMVKGAWGQMEQLLSPETLSQYSVPECTNDEIERAQHELYNHQVVHALRVAVTNGAATGPVGELNVSVVQTDELSDALVLASEPAADQEPDRRCLGCHTDTARRLRWWSTLALRLRLALKQTPSDPRNWETVGEAVERAETEGDKYLPMPDRLMEELEAAKYEVENRRNIDSLRAAVSHKGATGRVGQVNVSTVEPDALKAVIDAAAQRTCRTAEAIRLHHMAEAVLEMRTTLKRRDWGKLQPLILAVANYDHPAARQSDEDVMRRQAIAAQAAARGARRLGSARPASPAAGSGSSTASRVPLAAGGLPEPLRGELRLLQDELDDMTIREQCSAALTSGGPEPNSKIGELPTLGLQLTDLEEAASNAERIGPKTLQARQYVQSAFRILQLRRALKRQAWPRVDVILSTLATSTEDLETLNRAFDIPEPEADPEETGDFSATELGDLAGKGGPLIVSRCCQHEVLRVRAEANYRRALAHLTRALCSGTVTGVVGDLNLESIRIDTLEQAVAAADDLQIETPRFRHLRSLAQLVVELRRGAQAKDWERVERLLEERAGALTGSAGNLPAGCTLPEATRRELRLLAQEVDNRHTVQQLRDALLSGRPSGDTGHLNLQLVDVGALERAIETAVQLGCVTPAARCLMASAIHMRSCRLALLGGRWEDLTRLLAYGLSVANRNGIGPRTTEELRRRQAERAERRRARAARRQERRRVLANVPAPPPRRSDQPNRRLLAPPPPPRDDSEFTRGYAAHQRRQQAGGRPALLPSEEDEEEEAETLPVMLDADFLDCEGDGEAGQPPIEGCMGRWSAVDDKLPPSWLAKPGSTKATGAAAAAARAAATAGSSTRAAEGEEAPAGGAVLKLAFDIRYDGVASDAIGELRTCKLELDNRNIIVHLTTALRAGAAEGSIGHLDVSCVEVDSLDWSIGFAERVGTKTVEAQQMLHTAKLVRRLRIALKAREWEELQRVLEDARGKVLANIVEDEVRAAQSELDNRELLLALTAAMAQDKPQGEVGKLFIGNIRTEPLEDAIQLASTLGCQTPEAKTLFFTAKVLLQLRQALLDRNYNAASLTLHSIRGHRLVTVAMSEIRMVQDEVDNWTVVERLQAALAVGAAVGPVGALDTSVVETDTLQQAITEADEVGIKTDRAEQLANSAEVVLQLRRAQRAADWAATEAAVKAAASGPELDEVAAAEVQRASAELDHKKVVDGLTSSMQSGGATGSPGALETAVVDTAQLDAAIGTAVELGTPTDRSKRLLAAAKLVRRLRSVLREGAWEWVGAVLNEAREVKASFPVPVLRELQLAQDELDNRSVLAQLTAAIEQGRPEGTVGALAVDRLSTRQLDEAIAYARALGCQTLDAQQLLATAQLVRRLRQALRAGDMPLIREMLESVRGKVLAAAAAKEIGLIKGEVDNWVAISELTSALSMGRVSGDVGQCRRSAIDVSALDEAVATAIRLGCHTEEARRCLLSAVLVRRLRAAVKDNDLDRLRQALAEAEAERPAFVAAAEPEVDRCADELELHECLTALKAAAGKQEEEAVTAALQRATRLGLASHPDPEIRSVVEEATLALSRLQRCKAGLRAGMRAMSSTQLVDSIAMAAGLSFSHPLVDSAKETLERIRVATERATKALKLVDTTLMEASLGECEEMGLSLPLLRDIRGLLALPRGDYLRHQLSAALEQQDAARVAEATVALKDIFFEENAAEAGERCQWAAFERLKAPHLFSRSLSVLDGSAAIRMLSFQDEPIHTSLTKLPDAQERRRAVRCFRHVLAFMGDRAIVRPTSLLSEALMACRESEPLRDELFVQVCKQLTDNPHAGSVRRGWLLLRLCLEAVPPSEGLENHLEWFIRTSGRRELLTPLHLALYNGPVEAEPTTEWIEAKVAASDAPPLPVLPRILVHRLLGQRRVEDEGAPDGRPPSPTAMAIPLAGPAADDVVPATWALLLAAEAEAGYSRDQAAAAAERVARLGPDALAGKKMRLPAMSPLRAKKSSGTSGFVAGKQAATGAATAPGAGDKPASEAAPAESPVATSSPASPSKQAEPDSAVAGVGLGSSRAGKPLPLSLAQPHSRLVAAGRTGAVRAPGVATSPPPTPDPYATGQRGGSRQHLLAAAAAGGVVRLQPAGRRPPPPPSQGASTDRLSGLRRALQEDED